MNRYPSHISIETFHGCNARCTFCHVDQWARQEGQMTDQIFDTILKQLDGWGQSHITQTALMLNGEPLYDNKLEERLAKCKSAKLPNVGFTTNAQLLNEKRSEKVIQADPDYIVFSFDTLDKKLFEEKRLRLKHDRVLNNILRFIELRNKAKSNIRIVIRHIDFKADRKEFDNEYLEYFGKLLREDIDEIGYTKVHNSAVKESIDEKFQNNHCGTTPCGAVFNRLTIQHDGHVVLCPHDFNTEYDFGSVLESDLLKIFNSEKFNEVRLIHEQNKRNTMNKCKSCDEPELNLTGDMYAKYTPKGKLFYANVYTGFDHKSERTKKKI